MRKFKIAAVIVCVSLCFAALFSVACFASDVKLTDIEGHWAKEYIEYGVEKGYINGYTDNTFKPNKTVTRAEFSKMINSALGISGQTASEFNDVEDEDWFSNDVKRALYAGYIKGYDEDNTFRPNIPISRQEAAVVFSRIVLPVTQKASLDSFKDKADIADWAQDAIATIAFKGYMNGDQNGNVLPKGQLTRAEAAKLISELIKNENVVNGVQEIKKSQTVSQTIFTDGLVIDAQDDAEILLEDCRILGNIEVKSGMVVLSLGNSSADVITNNCTGDLTLMADKNSAVNQLIVHQPMYAVGDTVAKVMLEGQDLQSGTVELEGKFNLVEIGTSAVLKAEEIENLNVAGKKVTLLVQSGKIENLVVDKNAADSAISLTQKVTVQNATNNATVSYTGTGVIENAYNAVEGISYETLPKKQTGKIADEKTGSTTKEFEVNDNFFEEVTVSPTKGKTNVSTTASIVFTFDQTVTDSKGEKLTVSYLEDTLELRKTSSSGTKIAFSVTVNSTKKFTIKPLGALSAGTKYYVVIPEGKLSYADKSLNPKYSTYFNTAAAAEDDEKEDSSSDEDIEVTFSPKNGAEGVSIATPIKITFDGTVKAYSSSNDFDADYVEETVKIYENTTSGDEVSFTATVTSKTITLVPSGLMSETKYHVVIPANKFKVGGTTLGKTTMSFTTEAGVPIKISPENGATGVSTTPEITVSFAEPVLKVGRNHDPLDESYIQDDVLLLRRSSATNTKDEYQVSYSVTSIAENGRKFTIVPDEELESGETYYIIIQAESLYGETTEEENEKVTSSFKTASAMAPMFYPTDGSKNVSPATEIRISFSDKLLTYSTKSSERVEVTDEYLAMLIDGDENGKNKNRIQLKRGSSKVLDITATIDDDGKTIIITPDDPLEDDKTYTLSVEAKVFYNETGKKYNSAGSASFNTNIALSPTFTPKDDADEVAVTVKPTIKFDEKIYSVDEDNRTLKNAYLKDSIRFVDEYENEVEFKASATDTTITIEPEEELEGNTEYTLTLLAGTITNEYGEITNVEKSVTFKTKVSYTFSFTPDNEDAVSPLVTPTVKFGVPVLTTDDDAVDSDYAYDYIFLSKGKKATKITDTSVIPTTITVEEDGRTFTLSPDEELEFDTTYYIVVLKGGFNYDDDDGKSNAAASYSFKTIKKPAITNTTTNKPKVTSTTTTTVKITCTSNVKGEIVIEDENGTEVARKTNAKVGSNTIEVKELDPDTEYTFSIYVVYEEEIESEKVEITAKTKAE